jgi:Fe-S cluster assembly scaffold protein SufB
VFRLGVLLRFFLEVSEITELTVAFLLGPSGVTIHHVTQAETWDHKRALHKFCVAFAVAEGARCEKSEIQNIHGKKTEKNERKRVKHVKKQRG